MDRRDSMKYVYNKLVRDKIPEEINNIEGRKASYKINGTKRKQIYTYTEKRYS